MRSIVSIILFIIAASPAHAAKVREWVERGVLMIDVDLGRPTTVGMRNSGGEIYFQFSAEVGDNRALEQLETSRPQQLRDVQSGKNSLLLTGVEGASFQAWSTRNGVRVAVSGGGGQVTAPPRQAADDDHAVARRRLDVLRGRVELATGRPDVARQALEVARQRNPNDAETLTALAAAESELGRPNQALAYLDRAISARPDDPELARDRARILRDQAAYIEAYGGWRDTDDSDQESRTGVRIAARYGPKWRLGAEALVGHSRADAAQRTDGRIARVN
ncbi:MAG: tetratricopeptide repeat protein, partial [Alphaproteobacteria bacterium]